MRRAPGSDPRSAVRRRGGPRRRGLRDSDRRRRNAGRAGVLLAVLGLLGVVGGVLAGTTAGPTPTRVDPDGVTQVRPTWFFQNTWALYADVDDPRRPPSARQLGCATEGFAPPAQPTDITAYGSRVVGGTSISAVLLLGHSADGGRLRCAGASRYAPLWLVSSSDAPPFAPTAITLLGVLLLAAAALVHPGASEVPRRIRSRFRES